MSESKTDKFESKPILDKLAKGCGHQRRTFYTGELSCEKCRVEQLERENDELKLQLDTVISNCKHYANMAYRHETTINLLRDALDEAATTINANVGGETKVKEYRALAKQHKQG